MSSIIHFIYSLALCIISPFLLWGLYRSRPNKPAFGRRWKEHFGFTPPLSDRYQDVIWVHAVSVGEVLASKALVLALSQAYPNSKVLVTTTTSTGAEQAGKIGPNITHRYMPLDFSWCVRRFLSTIKPSLLVIVETEIWPNTINQVAKNGVPIVLVNGRLSEKSAANYRKLRFLISPALNRIQKLLVIHDGDRRRFAELGVPKNKLNVTGSIKFDVSVDDSIYLKGRLLREQLGMSRPVWIAASTHEGEERQVVQAYAKARKALPELLLICVPRHPERFNSVASLFELEGYEVARRTSVNSGLLSSTINVYLGDTVGEMMTMLAASDLVFMGGSLIGKKVGGHNFIEPAILGKPCVTGPSYYNFQDIAQQLIEVGALIVVEDSRELAEEVVSKFFDSEARNASGEMGCQVVSQNQGALSRVIDELSQFISSEKA